MLPKAQLRSEGNLSPQIKLPRQLNQRSPSRIHRYDLIISGCAAHICYRLHTIT